MLAIIIMLFFSKAFPNTSSSREGSLLELTLMTEKYSSFSDPRELVIAPCLGGRDAWDSTILKSKGKEEKTWTAPRGLKCNPF